MTKLAPRELGAVDAIEPFDQPESTLLSTLLLARWRVGARGALALRLWQTRGDSIAGEVISTLDTPEQISQRMTVRGALTTTAQEKTAELSGVGSTLRFSIALVDLDAGQALLLTDLPQQLGLLGGSYALEASERVRRTVDEFKSL